MSESTTFYLVLQCTNFARRLANITNNLIDLSTVPTKYYEFTNIFSKIKVEILAPHYLYNLQIKLENGEKLLVRTIYFFSTTKQETLKEFISENLNTRLINSLPPLIKY